MLLAAFLKGYDLLREPAGDGGSLFALLPAWVVVEGLLGLFLVSGLYPRAARIAGLTTFSLLAVVAVGKAVTGASDCGCFGPVGVNPWLVAGLDIVAVVLLAVLPVREPFPQNLTPLRTGMWAGGGALLAASVALLVLTLWPISRLAEDGEVVGDGRVVAVDPASWQGRRMPLLRHLDIGERLRSGEWIVMFHRENCPACKEALPAYLGLAHDLHSRGERCRVAIVDVPPWKEEPPGQPAGSPCLRGRLSDAHQWEIRTPQFVAMNAGVVDVTTSNAEFLLKRGQQEPGKPSKADRPGALSFPDYRQARRNRYLAEIACGPLSLLAVLRSLGVELSAEQEEELLNAAGDKGVDFLQLKELAEEHGVHALGVALTASDLARLNLPAVIHDGRFGFVAVTGYSSDGVRMVRPFAPAVVVSPEELTKQYGNSILALLVSRQLVEANGLGVVRQSEPKVKGPWLRPDKSVISIGRIYKPAWTASVKLGNGGDKPLHMKSVKMSCAGVSASVDDSILQPGQVTRLRVSGVQDKVGGINGSVEIVTNELFRKVTSLPVRGYLEQAVWVEPPAVSLEAISANMKARMEVGLGLEGGVTWDKVRVQAPAGVPIEGKATKDRDGSPRLALTWQGATKVGTHRFTLQVLPSDDGGYFATPLPVTVRVDPSVQVFPASVWLRESELTTTWTRRLTVRPRTDGLKVVIPHKGIASALLVQVSNEPEVSLITLRSRQPGSLMNYCGQSIEMELVSDGKGLAAIPLTLGNLQSHDLKEASKTKK